MQPLHRNTISQVFSDMRRKLGLAYEQREARRMVLILLEHFTGTTQQNLIAEPNHILQDAEIQAVGNALVRLLQYEPIQYITGFAHFYENTFIVTPDVLIPRPETEELVQWIVDEHQSNPGIAICDIGTGSGCIAISLSLAISSSHVEATDISDRAIRVAELNNRLLDANVDFFISDINNPTHWLQKDYDLIVSNPPYIPRDNKESLPINVANYEPATALFAPANDPLLFYRSIIQFSTARLKAPGWVYVEVHEDFADAVVELFTSAAFQNIELRCDMFGRKRMLRCFREKG